MNNMRLQLLINRQHPSTVQCRAMGSSLDCLQEHMTALKPCVNEEERKSVDDMHNKLKSVINYMCDNDAVNLKGIDIVTYKFNLSIEVRRQILTTIHVGRLSR